MAYIRFGERLNSGNNSNSYVFGDKEGLINIGELAFIKYKEIRELFKTKNDSEFKNELGKRLKLNGEELEEVCDRLFLERNNREWEKKFEFEK